MVEHDGHVGQLLKLLDDLGLADNTIVMYSTDNGAEVMSWPDGGTTPFRGEKATNWEGGWRVPAAIRWPGTIKPGSVFNGIGSHEDLLPTLLAAAGDPNVKEELLKGTKKIGSTTYKDAHRRLQPHSVVERQDPKNRRARSSFTGPMTEACWPFATTTGSSWFQEQRAHGADVWEEPFVQLRLPKLFNLRMDPFERADHEGIGYWQWRLDRIYLMVPAQAYVGQWLSSFKEFPPRHEAGQLQLGEGHGSAQQGKR